MRSGTFTIVGILCGALGTSVVLTSCEGRGSIESRRLRGRQETLPLESGWLENRPNRGLPLSRIGGGGGGGGGGPDESQAKLEPTPAPVAEVQPATLKGVERVEPLAGNDATVDTIGGTGLPPSAARDFRLVDVAFVSKIRGQGDYDLLGRRRFSTGERILLYGEFAGFGELMNASGNKQRGFAGTLKLRDTNGAELDSVVFLSKDAGFEPLTEGNELVNFWARYRIPDSLEPGRYELHVVATDLVTSDRSRVALSLWIESDDVEADLPTIGKARRPAGAVEEQAQPIGASASVEPPPGKRRAVLMPPTRDRERERARVEREAPLDTIDVDE